MHLRSRKIKNHLRSQSFISIYSVNSKTFFKHIVIGSGLSASSVCNALELKNEKDYLVISPDSERLIRSNVAGVNDYLIENIGFQGLSKFWHGVFATSDFAREKSKTFFKNFLIINFMQS